MHDAKLVVSLCGFSLNSHFSEGEFHHPRDSSPVKNGFSHIDPMLEVSIVTDIIMIFVNLYIKTLYVFQTRLSWTMILVTLLEIVLS